MGWNLVVVLGTFSFSSNFLNFQDFQSSRFSKFVTFQNFKISRVSRIFIFTSRVAHGHLVGRVWHLGTFVSWWPVLQLVSVILDIFKKNLDFGIILSILDSLPATCGMVIHWVELDFSLLGTFISFWDFCFWKISNSQKIQKF